MHLLLAAAAFAGAPAPGGPAPGHYLDGDYDLAFVGATATRTELKGDEPPTRAEVRGAVVVDPSGFRAPFVAVGDVVWFAPFVVQDDHLYTTMGTWRFGAAGCTDPEPADAFAVACAIVDGVPTVDGAALVQRSPGRWIAPGPPSPRGATAAEARDRASTVFADDAIRAELRAAAGAWGDVRFDGDTVSFDGQTTKIRAVSPCSLDLGDHVWPFWSDGQSLVFTSMGDGGRLAVRRRDAVWTCDDTLVSRITATACEGYHWEFPGWSAAPDACAGTMAAPATHSGPLAPSGVDGLWTDPENRRPRPSPAP